MRELAMQLLEAVQTEGGSYKLNCATVPLPKARAYAEGQCEAAGKDLNKLLPDFDEGYALLQKKCKQALDVPRIDMPVIEPEDMAKLDSDMKRGSVDIFKPYAKGKLYTPTKFAKGEEGEWIELGYMDGSKDDDVVKGKWTKIAAKSLIPTQSQIWLEKLISNVIKFGPPKAGSPVLNTTIIVSKEGYILDGHHRFGQCMISDPNLKIGALKLPVPIKLLLQVGRTYGTALGHAQKA